MILNLAVTTRDDRLAEDAYHVFKIKRGMKKSLSPNLTLTYFRTLHQGSTGLPNVVELTVDIANGADAPALANWLCRNLKEKNSKLEIEGAKVLFEEQGITHAINLQLNNQFRLTHGGQ